ncbi:hypothetical protein BT69DRAFT_1346214 [Atractiella rhizophila]|nr:hypothetical protein BT69DRAFT_1346214 [Atractiella rhizophila]
MTSSDCHECDASYSGTTRFCPHHGDRLQHDARNHYPESTAFSQASTDYSSNDSAGQCPYYRPPKRRRSAQAYPVPQNPYFYPQPHFVYPHLYLHGHHCYDPYHCRPHFHEPHQPWDRVHPEDLTPRVRRKRTRTNDWDHARVTAALADDWDYRKENEEEQRRIIRESRERKALREELDQWRNGMRVREVAVEEEEPTVLQQGLDQLQQRQPLIPLEPYPLRPTSPVGHKKDFFFNAESNIEKPIERSWQLTAYVDKQACWAPLSLDYKMKKGFEHNGATYKSASDAWNANGRRNLELILRAKFEKDPDLKKLLLLSGDRRIVVGNWKTLGKFTGYNLAEALMTLRAAYKAEEDAKAAAEAAQSERERQERWERMAQHNFYG